MNVDDNQFLTAIPTEDEVRAAVFDPSSVLSPDGFPGIFYQYSWSIIL